jgi:hypothetical protein
MTYILDKIGPVKFIFLLSLSLLMSLSISAQDFTDLFKNDLKSADLAFIDQQYQSALEGYLLVAERKNVPPSLPLKIAKCYFFTKQYHQAVKTYQKFSDAGKELPATDLYYYAEALAITGNYEKAIMWYEKCLAQDSENELLIKKIWRLSNRTYLFEDSVFYAVKEVPFNTSSGELSAVPYKKGVVFASNREQVKWVKKIDATTNAPFYQLYFSPVYKDLMGIGKTEFGTAVPFDKAFQSDFHTGPVCFYQGGDKMIFVSSNEKKVTGKGRTLQLHFAELKGGIWQITKSFPYNSPNYSNTDPSINDEGNILYFASDKPGGVGGMDMYVSQLNDSGWTSPQNLGTEVNTVGSEVSPYLHTNGTLYFSSNGHAGLGGLDIFKVELVDGEYKDLENLGYPLNSSHDDFGIFIDSLNNSGYLSSNRKNGGYQDDVYEFEMDLQPYPMPVTGIIKFIEHNWMDSSELRALPDVTLFLIDDAKDLVVAETVSDSEGSFKMIVPYYSKYKVRVVGDGIEGIVSFEVPKNKKANDRYDIVVVNDDFKTFSN